MIGTGTLFFGVLSFINEGVSAFLIEPRIPGLAGEAGLLARTMGFPVTGRSFLLL